MVLYGIASALSSDIEDFYVTCKEAEAALEVILMEEPEFEGELWIEGLVFELNAN